MQQKMILQLKYAASLLHAQQLQTRVGDSKHSLQSPRQLLSPRGRSGDTHDGAGSQRRKGRFRRVARRRRQLQSEQFLLREDQLVVRKVQAIVLWCVGRGRSGDGARGEPGVGTECGLTSISGTISDFGRLLTQVTKRRPGNDSS